MSARHVSFLENGRAKPSREMVLVLANALELPLRERNTLLTTAGFASVYRESPLDGERMAGVRRAVEHLLVQHEPYGALVVDRLWNLQRANEGAMRMIGFFVDVPPRNAMHALFDPRGLRPFVVGWEAVAAVMIERLHRERVGVATDAIGALIAELLAYPDVPQEFARPDLTAITEPVMPLHLRKGDVDVRLITMVSTIGTPIDVTADELRVESYFPADDASDEWLRSL